MGVLPFLVKVTHHETGKCTERVSKRNSLKLNAASHYHASWRTDTDGVLEHSPSAGSLYYKGPSLQKVIPVFWGPSSQARKEWALNLTVVKKIMPPQRLPSPHLQGL